MRAIVLQHETHEALGLLEPVLRDAGYSIVTRFRGVEHKDIDAELVVVHPRAEAAAIRIIVRAVRGGRGKLTIRPPLVLHDAGDAFREQADMINNGLASLFGD